MGSALLAWWGLVLLRYRRYFLAYCAMGLLVAVMGAILLLHWLIISSFPHWWAGHSYGPGT